MAQGTANGAFALATKAEGTADGAFVLATKAEGTSIASKILAELAKEVAEHALEKALDPDPKSNNGDKGNNGRGYVSEVIGVILENSEDIG